MPEVVGGVGRAADVPLLAPEALCADRADLHALGRLTRFVHDPPRDDSTPHQRELQRTDRGTVGHAHAPPGRILGRPGRSSD